MFFVQKSEHLTLQNSKEKTSFTTFDDSFEKFETLVTMKQQDKEIAKKNSIDLTTEFSAAIIGAGQLGSRHLQGILKSELTLNVFVVDPFQTSLDTAKVRAEEIEHNHSISFYKSIDRLPKHLDFVLIASNADKRAEITHALLKTKSVSNLVLEKVLFQKLEDYESIANVLVEKNVSTWVNHPRRSQPIYKELNNLLKGEKNIDFSFYGENWGLACNGLHMLDIISQLSNSEIASISTDELNREILTSKRPGNIELTGNLRGATTNNSTFSVQSTFSKDSIRPVSLMINTPEKRYFVQEGGTCFLTESSTSNGYQPETKSFPFLYQSDLSAGLITDILTKQNCDLPTYLEAKSTHKVFIKEILDFYNKATQQNLDTCPIT